MARMLYVIWPDTDYLDAAVDSGAIDTLLVAFYSHPWAPAPDHFDSWWTSVSVLERYKGRVKLLACPVIMEKWMPVDLGHRFVSGGKEDRYTFCPTSQYWMGLIFAPFKELQARGLISGIIYDVENYVGGPRLFQQQIRCECSRCNNWTFDEQWRQRAAVMRRDDFNSGQLIYNTPWSLQCYPNAQLLTEDTYGTKGLCDSFKLRRKLTKAQKNSGLNYSIVPGVFIETFKDLGVFLAQLKYWKKHYGGWWIYSQKIFSKFSKISEAEMNTLAGGFGYYERRLIDQVDSNFFNSLKEV